MQKNFIRMPNGRLINKIFSCDNQYFIDDNQIFTPIGVSLPIVQLNGYSKSFQSRNLYCPPNLPPIEDSIAEDIERRIEDDRSLNRMNGIIIFGSEKFRRIIQLQPENEIREGENVDYQLVRYSLTNKYFLSNYASWSKNNGLVGIR